MRAQDSLYHKFSQMRVFGAKNRGAMDMKDLLDKMRIMESEMELVQQKSDYWLEEEHFCEEKAAKFEKKADVKRIFE